MAVEIKEQAKMDALLLFPSLKEEVKKVVEKFMKNKKNVVQCSWNLQLVIDYTESNDEEHQLKIM
jgi:hypothetical protein